MIKKIINYVLLIIMFILIDKIINVIPMSSYNDYYLIKEENNRLKEDIVYLSKLDYDNYELCKININNLYSSNTYFLKCDFDTNNNIVLNDIGFIGIVNNNKLTLAKDLILSVKVNDNKGILKNNKISIIKDNYNIGDSVYVSYLNEEYLLGYISKIVNNANDDTILIDYIDINNSYVVVLK